MINKQKIVEAIRSKNKPVEPEEDLLKDFDLEDVSLDFGNEELPEEQPAPLSTKDRLDSIFKNRR